MSWVIIEMFYSRIFARNLKPNINIINIPFPPKDDSITHQIHQIYIYSPPPPTTPPTLVNSQHVRLLYILFCLESSYICFSCIIYNHFFWSFFQNCMVLSSKSNSRSTISNPLLSIFTCFLF